ncbi:hypothetical protein OH77DRAFT_1097906 [Trametes cingulata]|nr:hypothetical protein OH77DRAFT_1097906 [Trametes cingulata]
MRAQEVSNRDGRHVQHAVKQGGHRRRRRQQTTSSRRTSQRSSIKRPSPHPDNQARVPSASAELPYMTPPGACTFSPTTFSCPGLLARRTLSTSATPHSLGRASVRAALPLHSASPFQRGRRGMRCVRWLWRFVFWVKGGSRAGEDIARCECSCRRRCVEFGSRCDS